MLGTKLSNFGQETFRLPICHPKAERLPMVLLALCTMTLGQVPGQAEPAPKPEQAVLELAITDAQTQELLPARVRLRDGSGDDHVPDGAVEVPIGPDRWFVADGTVSLQVRAGRMNVRVERGTEYDPVCETIDIGSKPALHHKVALKRWVNLGKLGYLNGEDHLHVTAAELPAMLAAEGLDFGNSLSWWNGPQFGVAPGEPVRTLSYGKYRIAATVFNAEVERPWGAVYLIGLKTPLRLEPDAKRSNLGFVRVAREQGALVCYQGGWSREVLLDALLGYVDVVNVCNNNFHRHKYQPRREYSNLLGVEGFPDYPETPEGMMQMNTETYYRLLNCGLRLAAGAGSATGAKTTPVGYNRSYARLQASARLEDFLESWRKGRNFVTDGPMVFLTANGSASPGDTIALPQSGGTIHLEARALCNQPLRAVEIVVNGSVVARATLPETGHEARTEANVKIQQGSWVAARATAEDRLLSDEEMARYDNAGSGSRLAKPCRLQFGHTSPLYVTVGGTGAAVSTSLSEASRMLDAFERFALKTAAEQYRSEILEALRTAREKLKERIH